MATSISSTTDISSSSPAVAPHHVTGELISRTIIELIAKGLRYLYQVPEGTQFRFEEKQSDVGSGSGKTPIKDEDETLEGVLNSDDISINTSAREITVKKGTSFCLEDIKVVSPPESGQESTGEKDKVQVISRTPLYLTSDIKLLKIKMSDDSDKILYKIPKEEMVILSTIKINRSQLNIYLTCYFNISNEERRGVLNPDSIIVKLKDAHNSGGFENLNILYKVYVIGVAMQRNDRPDHYRATTTNNDGSTNSNTQSTIIIGEESTVVGKAQEGEEGGDSDSDSSSSDGSNERSDKLIGFNMSRFNLDYDTFIPQKVQEEIAQILFNYVVLPACESCISYACIPYYGTDV